jgi:hypothetical protein
MSRWPGLVRRLALVGLLSLAGAGGLAAQGAGWGRGAGGAGPGAGFLRDSLSATGPVELLLAHSDSIGLSQEQVRTLETIAGRLREENAPLIQALLDARAELQPLIGRHPRQMSQAERAELARQSERARPLMHEINRNTARAMVRVGAVLTAEQRRQVRQWLERSGVAGTDPPGAGPGEPQRQRNRWRGGQGGGGSAP